MKSVYFKELIRQQNVEKIKLKSFLETTDFFDNMEDFNKSINGKKFNFDKRNSILLQKHDKYNLTIYDLDGYVLHEIVDCKIIN